VNAKVKRLGLAATVAALVIALDQATKTWALQHLASGPRHVIWTLQLNLQFNTGMAFSQARGSTPVVTVVALALVSVLVVVVLRTKGTGSALLLGMIIGGALGNLVDRLVRHHSGAVIDFIDVRWWPVFNVADAAVSIGAVLAILTGLIRERVRA
jgi:signal peptidase II